MQIAKTSNFERRYRRLPKPIQKQVDKQLGFLKKNFYYPSLNTKRLGGFEDWWEFRVSRGYRMVGKKIDDTLILHTVGPHDVGLGKK